MYEENEFYYLNPSDIEDKYLPYYEECFKVEIMEGYVYTPISESVELSEFNTFEYVHGLIDAGKVNHIYEYVNMFFMFKEQYEVIEHRYLMRNRFGDIMENPVQLADRVATFVALAEPHDQIAGFSTMTKWYPIFLKKLINMEISPNTPTWVSAGIPGFGSFACVVVDNDDSLKGISKWYRDTMYLNRYNFGIGHSLHKFRPKGSPFSKSKVNTKSSLHWAFPIQELAEGMSQGASGRGGANMISIPVWHPDVIEFINYKSFVPTANGGKVNVRKSMKAVMNSDLPVEVKKDMIDALDQGIPLKNFNMSVLVNDNFMEAVRDDQEWEINFSLPDHNFKLNKKYKATYIYDLICKTAWESADPGLLFYDRINEDNMIKAVKNSIYTTNPSLPYDTRISTDNGLIPIGELAENGHANVFNKYGQMVKALVFQDGWNEDVVLVKFRGGMEIEMTPDHELVNTFHKKIKAKNLKSGDKILTSYNPLYNMREVIDHGEAEKGFVFGVFTGDGHVSKCSDGRDQYGLCLGKKEYESFGIKVLDIINKINGVDAVSYSDHGTYYEISSSMKEFRDLMKSLGYNKDRVPETIFRGRYAFVKGFIDGLFSTDGSVSVNGNSLLLINKSKEFLHDVLILLSYYGIKSNIHGGKQKTKPKFPNGKEYDREYYRYCLNINGRNLLKFVNIFSLSHNEKQMKIIEYVSKEKENGRHHSSKHIIVDSVVALKEKKDVFTMKMLDRTNEFNLYGIVSGNCGEIPLHPFSVCNLWTINLVKHVDFYHRKIAIRKLQDTINITVRAADNLITVNQYPMEVPEIEKSAKEERRIGIDFTGLADYLYITKYKYGTKEATSHISELYKTLRDTARGYSVKLGKKKGSFPLWKKSDYRPENGVNIAKCERCGAKTEKFDDYVQCSRCNWVKFEHIRNMHLLTQAPTGTRSRKLGVSFGIEPNYYKWWKSNVMEGKVVYNTSRILEWFLKKAAEEQKLDYNDLCSYIEKENLIISALDNWVESHELSPQQHLKVQAAAQQWIDQAVSKTINLPNSATVDDIKLMYMLAWESGLKGITMYREGSHYKEVIGKTQKCPECGSENLLAAEGCMQCMNCPWSKCSM